MGALQANGGDGAVDDAFRDPRVSTEQIVEPDAYPGEGRFRARIAERSRPSLRLASSS